MLVSYLDSKVLLTKLFEMNVITLEEMEELKQDSTMTMNTANPKLLQTMANKSMATFRLFLDALKDTKQNEIYSSLSDVGKDQQ